MPRVSLDRAARRIWIVAVAITGLGAAGCVGEVPVVPESLARGITGGQTYGGYPAVGLLVFAESGAQLDGACTATLVGERTVVTAAHCLGYPQTAFVEVDKNLAHREQRHVIHPQWSSGTPYLNDIGLVELKVAPALEPLPLATSSPKPGQQLQLVGYGSTAWGAGDNGVKRAVDNSVAEVEALYFTVNGAGGCEGDSGGPALANDGGHPAVLGLMSFVPGSCGSTTRLTRLDKHLQWLAAQSNDLTVVDRQPPQVTITAPTDGGSVGASFVVEVEATDDQGLVSVELRVDGTRQTEVDKPPYVFELSLARGGHQLTAIGRDRQGNFAESTVSVSVIAEPSSSGDSASRATDAGVDAERRSQGAGARVQGGCAVGGATTAASFWFAFGLLLGWLCRGVRLAARSAASRRNVSARRRSRTWNLVS